MKTRADYERAFQVVRDVIHGWDPSALIQGGAPSDEWDREIASLITQIPRIKSEADAVAAVSRVFTSAFQPEGFGISECSQAGKQLFAALREAGLIFS